MKIFPSLMLFLLAPLSLPAAEPAGRTGDPAALAAEGNVAWRADRHGEAVLGWERALALDPHQTAALAGVTVAEEAGAKAPTPSSAEIYAAFLPENVWTAIAVAAFWIAVIALALPYVAPVPRRSAHHTVAGIAATFLLLAAPGAWGAATHRARGVILKSDTALLLTPTRTGESLGVMEAGDRVRIIGGFGEYRHIMTADDSTGWVKNEAMAPVTPGS